MSNSGLDQLGSLIPVLKISPDGMGNPMVFRLDEKNSWGRVLEKLKALTESEDNLPVRITGGRMMLSEYLNLGEHQGW